MDVLPELRAVAVEDPPWTGWDVLLLPVIAFASIIFTSLLILFTAHWTGNAEALRAGKLDHDARVMVPIQLLAYAITFAVMYALVTRRYGRQFWAGIKWNWPRSRWFVFPVAGVGLAIAVQFTSILLPFPKSLPIEEFFKHPGSAYALWLFGISAAPFIEEVFFRGFFFPVVVRRAGVAGGLILTSAVFALIHQAQYARAWAPLLVLFLVGLVFTTVRLRTNSVAASFLVHVGYNFTLFAMVWLVTSGFRNMERLAK